MKDSRDWIKFEGDHIVCKICGAKVERGIISVSGHWKECAGKEIMGDAEKIANMPLRSGDKLGLIKKLFNIEQ